MAIIMKQFWDLVDQFLAKLGAATVIILFIGYLLLSDPNRVLVIGKRCVALTVPEKATLMLSSSDYKEAL